MAARVTTALAGLLLAGCASTDAANGAGSPPAVGASAERAGQLLELKARAEQAYAASSHAEAATLYTELVKAMPNEPDFWYRLGNVLVRSERYDEAAYAYGRTTVLQPNNGRAWHNLGVVRMRQAQEALAQGVKHADADRRVFDDSLKLSTGLYSLINHSERVDKSAAAAPRLQPQPEPLTSDPPSRPEKVVDVPPEATGD